MEFDPPWKLALEWKLDEAIALCFPAVHRLVDWRHRWEDLQTELQKLAPEHSEGRHTVDKLFKVRLRTGEARLLHVHLEIQAQPDKGFALRMWVYHYRLYDRYGAEALSLAILADADAEWRPRAYHHEFAGCVQHFEFPVFKVLDCGDPEGIFERTGNRFALVVAAQQAALRTRGDAAARGRERLRLVKYLYRKGLEKEEVVRLFRLMAWLTRLPKDLELKFSRELAQYERAEKPMTIETLLSPIELIARQEGRQEGWQKGRVEADQQLVLRQLRRGVGELTPTLLAQVQALPVELIEQLGEDLLSFSARADLETWLASHALAGAATS